MTTKGIYIYVIAPEINSTDMSGILEVSGVYAINYRKISAIVSDRENAFIDYSDKESLGYLLVHHQKTIEKLMNNGLNHVIPMKLGTIVTTKEEVVKIIANGYDLIIDILKKIEHLTEIDIAVTWADFPVIINEIASHPDIITMKDDILSKTHSLTPIDQVKLGMLIQTKLTEKNTKLELNILDSLSPISIDIKTHELMNDQMITNSAFLINENKKEKFEQIIDQLDEEYKGQLNFKLVGSLPCYSFYTIEVKELNLEQVEQAKKELDLSEETSESAIKKAYLGKAKLFHPDTQTKNAEENFNKINKAYHTMIDFSTAVRQAAKENLISMTNKKASENLILVKIKE